jgi:hypothetical protein
MTPKELIAEARNQAQGARSFSSHRTEPWFLDELASTIERLAGALEEIAESGAPRDEHELGTVDVWLRGLARSALSGEPTP